MTSDSSSQDLVPKSAARSSLRKLFSNHTGNASDKWSSYIDAYDDLLNGFRDRKISLLEIGIQNGGSLEIWKKYFTNAQIILGLDLDPRCKDIKFENDKISVVIGDASKLETRDQVCALSPDFDVIIDDGSHKSRHIIESFLLFYPMLVDDGIYIIEDLHCSYWSKFQGGLFNPHSSINFLKLLIDIINKEHWFVPLDGAELLSRYSGQINDRGSLNSIYSIEFRNSLCILRRKCTPANSLGDRLISGNIAAVDPQILKIDHKNGVFIDQSQNPWSQLQNEPENRVHSLLEKLDKLTAENRELAIRVKELEQKYAC